MNYASPETYAKGDVAGGANWNGYTFRARLLESRTSSSPTPRKASRSGWTMRPSSADAQNVENAKLFLNFIMAPENAAMLSAFARYSNGIMGSEKFMPADMQGAPELTLPEGQQGRVPPGLPARGQRDHDPDLDRAAEVDLKLDPREETRRCAASTLLAASAGTAAARARRRTPQACSTSTIGATTPIPS